MRPVMHGDVVAAARAIYAHPEAGRADLLKLLVAQAEAADQHRVEFGAMHPLWGDGSLMTAALAMSPPPEPSLQDLEYCGCLATVFDTLVTVRRN